MSHELPEFGSVGKPCKQAAENRVQSVVRAGLWASVATVSVAALIPMASGARASLPQTQARHQCGLVPRGFTCSSATRVRFAYPSGWHAARYLVSSSFDRSLIYLSSAGPHDPCVTTQEGSGTKVSCGWQVSKLEPEEVAAKWLTGDGPGWNLGSVPGKPRTAVRRVS
jgi:hypothetical protein